MKPSLTTYFITLLLLLNYAINSLALADPETIDYIVAIVNDEVIVNSVLQQETRLIVEDLRRQNIELPPRPELEKQVLDQLITTTIQLQLAQRLGLTVEDNVLNEAIRNVAAQNKMDLAEFRRVIETQGYTYERYRDNVRNQLMISRLQQRQVTNRINVTAPEIDNFLINQAQVGKSKTDYHLLHILIEVPEAASPEVIAQKQQQAEAIFKQLQEGADFKATAVAVSNSPKALEGGDLGWLQDHEVPSLFQDLVPQMKTREISKPLRNASGFHIIKLVEQRQTGKTVVTQTKVRHILIKTNELVSDFEAQSRLERLKARLEQGEDFGELAKANSEDAGSAANGGLLEWVNPGDLTPEFEEVMNKTAESQISDPFKSRYGWHLLTVLARRQHDNTDQAIRTNAAKQIQKRKVEEELQSWLRQLRDESYIEIKSGQ